MGCFDFIKRFLFNQKENGKYECNEDDGVESVENYNEKDTKQHFVIEELEDNREDAELFGIGQNDDGQLGFSNSIYRF
jgi:hypothetical protein